MDVVVDAPVVLLHAVLLVVADDVGVHFHALDAEGVVGGVALVAMLRGAGAAAILLIGEPEEDCGCRGQDGEPERWAYIGTQEEEAKSAVASRGQTSRARLSLV